MKHLYLIGGTMGVGKTTACQKLKHKLPDSVFLDGDWCWDMHPFQVTPETKKMVMENICFLLNQLICRAEYSENRRFPHHTGAGGGRNDPRSRRKRNRVVMSMKQIYRKA